METTPLPTPYSEESDSDTITLDADDSPLIDYVLRVTPHDKFTFQQLEEFINAEHDIFRYVIGRETNPREHFHLVVSVDEQITEQQVRDIIKAFIVPYWAVDGKLPKGFGNKQYNLQVTETLDQAVSYAVKYQEYVFEGFDGEYIEQRVKASFKKPEKASFTTELRSLRQTFMDTDQDIREFMIAYAQLKAKFDQQVIMAHIYGYANSILIKRNPAEAVSMVENFLYRM